LGVDYPIAIDTAYAIWNAFDNQYWPALYVIDAQGHIVHHQFGEGGYKETEKLIQKLLGVQDRFTTVDARGAELDADSRNLRSPETYVGSERAENFDSPGGASFGERSIYQAPGRLALNHWALSGDWTVETQAAVLNKPNGRIAVRFHARDVNLVMSPGKPGTSARFRVLIDGRPPAPAHGVDVDEQGNGTLSEPRLYQLIRQPAPIVDRQFEIEFLDAGVQAFSFTFG
jgi:hypothetical protein